MSDNTYIYSVIEKQDAVRDLVVAVDRYVDRRNEVDQAVHDDLLRKMNAANEKVAELFNVYPLQGGEQ